MAAPEKAQFAPEQKRALLIGGGVILVAAGLLLLIWLGMFLPGFAGEVFRKLAGFLWTPLILDFSLFILGVILVLSLNWYIRVRKGDECVYLEQVEDPPDGLPERARSAIFSEEPEPQGLAPKLAAIEGALTLNDLSEATSLLFELPESHLEDPDVLALRITLARRKEHTDRAELLLQKLMAKSPQHPLVESEEGPRRSHGH
ncbi:MAG TPA: hypothetical protein DIV39_10270 [Verrucomicrobiales bacterium]|nr:hypothetical protein [Verrucomicrobiales bacterium]